ncbi:MAG: SRPBCC family protein [Propionibacteriaceae bacterium]|nr:SRPBCC family protein [Propionibacteriaceae bacterium]
MRYRNLIAAAAVGVAGYQLNRWMSGWGASEDEIDAGYPGDELIDGPAGQTTMAVTIAAPAERIWAWLVQIGQDRGGMYSYDRLEQAIGLDIRSAERINPDWQHLEPGDRVRLVPPGWGPLPDGYAFKVSMVDPPNTLVLRQGPPEDPWDGVWTFAIRPIGPGLCRLISRTRTHRDPGPAAAVLRAVTTLGAPITWLMTRKMLLTLKERAERPGQEA